MADVDGDSDTERPGEPLGCHMSTPDAERILATLTGAADGQIASLESLCRRIVEMLPVDGASVALTSPDRGRGATAAFGRLAQPLEDLEFTLGEGPGVEAFTRGGPVVIDDLEREDGHWPLFTEAATGLGVGAVYALPLQLGVIKLGVLVLYCGHEKHLTFEELSAAMMVASLLAKLVIEMQSTAAGETLARSLDVSDYRAVVHQAAGMVSVQAGCGVEEALVLLRGRAFAADRLIDEVSHDVVAGNIRFDPP